MISKWTIVYTCALIAFCESAYVDTIEKCAIDDNVCLKDLIQNIIREVGKSGFPEHNIEAVDPMKFKDLKVPILGLLTIYVEDGEARGIKDCVIEDLESDPSSRHFMIGIVCDLNIKVKIKLGEINPLIQNSLGTNSHEGSGNAKVKLVKLQLNLDFFYDIVKKEDELYIKYKPDKVAYKYDIGDADIVVDKIIVGDKDLSEPINEFFKQNTTIVLKTVGNNFFDVALDIMGNILIAFFDNTPTKYFISSDLSKYV